MFLLMYVIEKNAGICSNRWLICLQPHDKDDLVTIDLRTVTSLVKCPKGELLQLDIVTVDK